MNGLREPRKRAILDSGGVGADRLLRATGTVPNRETAGGRRQGAGSLADAR